MGGINYVCGECGSRHTAYKSCGNSHCMICQGKKRIEWQLKIAGRLYEVPYAHVTFTLPEELRNVARINPRELYNILFRSAWATIKELSADEENIGALPGMVGVLHTFGSDLKYHVHVHCLVSFGGLDKDYNWVNPKRRDKIAGYRKLRNRYRKIFLGMLKKEYDTGNIDYHLSYEELASALENKTWVVNHQPPVLDTERIENYLSKYICRTAVTPQRINYDSRKQMVELLHKNYKSQKKGEPAPLETKHLFPLDALDMIMQHKLPVGFHKSRYYGIHSTSTAKKIRPLIPVTYLRESKTLKQLLTILRLVEQLLGLPDSSVYRCKQCGSMDIDATIIGSDRSWPSKHIKGFKIPRSPPRKKRKTYHNKTTKVAVS